MCLTVPGQIVALTNKEAQIKVGQRKQMVDLRWIGPKIKIGDWLLMASGRAVRRVDPGEAREIIDLLEKGKEKLSRGSAWLEKILAARRERDLSREEIIELLRLSDRADQERLFAEADRVRRESLPDFVCLHGIIEISNYCHHHCHYCGLRAENESVERYRMTEAEILGAVGQGVGKGYKMLVLQSGDDLGWSDEALLKLIERIKSEHRVFIFLSLGERSRNFYREARKLGADGVLFRFETSKEKLYDRIHPGQKWADRLDLLNLFFELGYLVSTGPIIGLPGQTVEDLADDILLMKRLGVEMVSMGPFVPSNETPMGGEAAGSMKMVLKMMAVTRLVMPKTRIPVTTAMETLDFANRKKALLSGANGLMFNLTPAQYRDNYQIYPNKFFRSEEMFERYGLFSGDDSYEMLEEALGRSVKKY